MIEKLSVTDAILIATRGRTAEGVLNDVITGKHDEIKKEKATIWYSNIYIKY